MHAYQDLALSQQSMGKFLEQKITGEDKVMRSEVMVKLDTKTALVLAVLFLSAGALYVWVSQ